MKTVKKAISVAMLIFIHSTIGSAQSLVYYNQSGRHYLGQANSSSIHEIKFMGTTMLVDGEFDKEIIPSATDKVVFEDANFLAGKFAVGSNKFVRFTRGNLQYDITAQKYQLAREQYESCTSKYTVSDNYIVNTEEKDANNHSIIDYYGWGTGKWPTYSGAYDYKTYYKDAKDPDWESKAQWDQDNLQENGWGACAEEDLEFKGRVLTEVETLYFLRHHICSLADVLYNGGTARGLIVFPYDCDVITANSFLMSGMAGNLFADNDYEEKYDEALSACYESVIDYENLCNSGALFLPNGYYWTATSANSAEAFYLYMEGNRICYGYRFTDREKKYKVRLVKDW